VADRKITPVLGEKRASIFVALRLRFSGAVFLAIFYPRTIEYLDFRFFDIRLPIRTDQDQVNRVLDGERSSGDVKSQV
jgi:hypothetical protein